MWTQWLYIAVAVIVIVAVLSIFGGALDGGVSSGSSP
jgi:hypothetical protein